MEPAPEASPSNRFTAALQFWTSVDLPSLQKKLDAQGLEISEAQTSSLVSRKNLAAKTKELRKLPDDQKLAELQPLLKLYQNEIDQLTRKRQTIESYFFDFYRSLAEAPDPKPLLELSVDAVAESADVAQYRQEIDQLTQELAKKADYAQLKQRLLRSEQSAAELLSAKLRAKDDEYKALIEEKEANWAQQQSLAQKQLDDYKTKIEELRTTNEVAELQLSSQNQQLGGDHNLTVLAELELVSRDAESAKRRVLEVEKRNEDLRRQLTISNTNVELENARAGFAKSLSELEGENALLVAELGQTRKTIDQLTKSHEAAAEASARDLAQLAADVQALRAKTAATSDYDDIKRELHFLRQAEFDDGSEDEDSDARNKVDSFLAQKNKALTAELATYRSQHDELTERVQRLESEVASATEQVSKVQALNVRLEEDLSKFNDTKFSDNVSLISGFSKRTAVDESAILPIITKQRDRFKKRSGELEEDLKKQFNLVSELRRQLAAMKKDNEELYERTRFLASLSSTRSRNLQPRANSDLEANTYKDTYESKLHPIEQFRMREQERINSRLSPVERIFISVTRAVLATRATRMLFFLYCLGLHCIVMVTTIYSTAAHARELPEVGHNRSTGGKTA